MRRITVFHNIAADAQGRNIAMLEGYTPGHPLVPVLQWLDETDRLERSLLEVAFHELNVGEHSDIATRYRLAKNRSLSVGDCVAISDVSARGTVQTVAFFACAPSGWDADFQPPFYVWASQYGTTALDPGVTLPWQP